MWLLWLGCAAKYPAPQRPVAIQRQEPLTEVGDWRGEVASSPTVTFSLQLGDTSTARFGDRVLPARHERVGSALVVFVDAAGIQLAGVLQDTLFRGTYRQGSQRFPFEARRFAAAPGGTP